MNPTLVEEILVLAKSTVKHPTRSGDAYLVEPPIEVRLKGSQTIRRADAVERNTDPKKEKIQLIESGRWYFAWRFEVVPPAPLKEQP